MNLATPIIPQNMGDYAMASHGNDRNLFVEFSTKAIEITSESEKEGRPVYKNVDFITIQVPGDTTKKVVRKVAFTHEEANGNMPDPERFPAQWNAYKGNQEQIASGTPLTLWPPIDLATIEELKFSKIFTVEQLSSVPDSSFDKLPMGAKAWRDKAKSWLSSAQGNAELSRLNSENNSLKHELELVKKQLEDLASHVNAEKRSPGRPRLENRESIV